MVSLEPGRPAGRAFVGAASQPPARLTVFPPARNRRYDTQSFAVALDFNRNVAIHRGADDGTELARIGNRLPIDGEHSVAGAQTRAPPRARGVRRIDQRGGIPR